MDHLLLQLKHQYSTSKHEEQFFNNSQCPTFLPAQPQVISTTPASVALLGAMQAPKSPLPSCPSTPSSPSSSPSSPSSSPSSSYSSPVATATSFQDSSLSGVAGVSQSEGGAASSTSVLLPLSIQSFPLSSTPSVHRCSTPSHPSSGEDQENVEIYDPFHPTEGEGEPDGEAAKEEVEDDKEDEEEEEVGDKYDPFEPTGSPGSDQEQERRVECTVSVESDGRETMGVTGEQKAGSDEDEKEMAPSYSLTVPPASPISTQFSSHHHKHREEGGGGERGKERAVKVKGLEDRIKDKGKGGKERREANSDNSEIEEGEIVPAGEGDGKRERRDREGVRGHLLDHFFLPSCSKPERIIRVLEGDDFVSVRAEGDKMAERDGGATTGVGDLRKLVSRRKERYRSRSRPSSASLSPPPACPWATPSLSLPVPTEKAKSRKSSKGFKERERHKRKQEREGERAGKSRRKRMKEGSYERKQRDKDGEWQGRDKERKEGASRSSHGGSSRRKKRRSMTELFPHSRSRTSLHERHSRCSWSSTAEDRHKDRDRDRKRNGEREQEYYRDHRDGNGKQRRDVKERREERNQSSQRRKRERGKEDGDSPNDATEGSRRQRVTRQQDRERDSWREGRPVVPPSIQELNGSDLFAIKRMITVTTTTTTTIPGSPQLPQTAPDTPCSSNKQRKMKHERKSLREEEDFAEDEERLSRSGESSLTPVRYCLDYDSDHFSDKLRVDMLSLDGEAMDSDYSREDSPLPPITPPLSIKTQPMPKYAPHIKKKSRTRKKKTARDSLLRQKAKSPPSLSPISIPLVPAPTPPVPRVARRKQKMGKEKEKVGKKERGQSGKERGQSGKSKRLSSSTKKGKLQSKVSVLVREGVSSTIGGSRLGKLGVIASTNELPGPGGAGSGTVVGGSIAVVFQRDNESRSSFLKPSSEPISLSGRSKDFGQTRKTSTFVHPSSSSSCVSSMNSKKAKPSSTTYAHSSAASSPSSFFTIWRRKQGRKQRKREKGRMGVEGDGANTASSVEGGSWALSVLDIQSGSTGNAKPSNPPPEPPAPTPSSSSSSSTSVPPPSFPCTPPLSIHPSHDTRESTPDSQTVDSSCKTPEPNFLSEDGPTQSQTTLLTPISNVPSSPLPLKAAQVGISGISESATDLKTSTEEQKAPTSPPCSSSSKSVSVFPSSVDSNSSVSSSSANKPPSPPPPPAVQPLPWSLQTGVDTAGGVLALTALLFKMEEANLANRAKAQEFIQATSQILSQAKQSQSQQLPLPPSSSSSFSSLQPPPPPPSLAAPPGPVPSGVLLHSSLPLVGCTKTLPSHLYNSLSLAGGCAQTPPHPRHGVSSGAVGPLSESGWDSESKDPEKYMKRLHTQEQAVEEVKLAIKPYYQRQEITKEDYKDILRKAVNKICHSCTGEINPIKVSNLVKLYVQRYKYFRKHGRKMDEGEG